MHAFVCDCDELLDFSHECQLTAVGKRRSDSADSVFSFEALRHHLCVPAQNKARHAEDDDDESHETAKKFYRNCPCPWWFYTRGGWWLEYDHSFFHKKN